MKMFLILCSFLKCAALNRGGAVPIVKWNGIEWNWSRSRRGVSGGVAWVVGVKLRWQQCCARQRNKCCILCSAPGTRQSQCECRTPKTHTNRRTHTHTQTNTRFLSMLFIIPPLPLPPRSTPPAIVKNLCCVFHIQLGRNKAGWQCILAHFYASLLFSMWVHLLCTRSIIIIIIMYTYACMRKEVGGGRGRLSFCPAPEYISFESYFMC